MYDRRLRRQDVVALFSHWYSVYTSPANVVQRHKPQSTPKLRSPRAIKGAKTAREYSRTKYGATWGTPHLPRKLEGLTFAQRRAARRSAQVIFKPSKPWDGDTAIDYDDTEACSLYTLELQEQKAVAGLWVSQTESIHRLYDLVSHPAPSPEMVHHAEELYAGILKVFADSESQIALRDFNCSQVIQELLQGLIRIEDYVYGPSSSTNMRRRNCLPSGSPHRFTSQTSRPVRRGPAYTPAFSPTSPKPLQPYESATGLEQEEHEKHHKGVLRAIVFGMELSGSRVLSQKLAEEYGAWLLDAADVTLSMLPSLLGQSWVIHGSASSMQGLALLRRSDESPQHIFFVHTSEEVLVERYQAALFDPTTSRLYHPEFEPAAADVEGLVNASIDALDSTMTMAAEHKEAQEALHTSYLDVGCVVDGDKPVDDQWSQTWGLILQARTSRKLALKTQQEQQQATERQRSMRHQELQLKMLRDREQAVRTAQIANLHKIFPTKADQIFSGRERHLAALKIQQTTRSRKALTAVANAKVQRNAARDIQRLQRGKLGRKKACSEREFQQHTVAAISIQSAQRRVQARERATELRSSNAAVRIQALQRGRIGRNHVKSMKHS